MGLLSAGRRERQYGTGRRPHSSHRIPPGWFWSTSYAIFPPPIWELAPPLDMPFLAGILTISDKGAAGEREDTSGAAVRELLSGLDVSVERYEVIPDERAAITQRLIDWADVAALDLIVTTGGTGLAPRRGRPPAA